MSPQIHIRPGREPSPQAACDVAEASRHFSSSLLAVVFCLDQVSRLKKILRRSPSLLAPVALRPTRIRGSSI